MQEKYKARLWQAAPIIIPCSMFDIQCSILMKSNPTINDKIFNNALGFLFKQNGLRPRHLKFTFVIGGIWFCLGRGHSRPNESVL